MLTGQSIRVLDAWTGWRLDHVVLSAFPTTTRRCVALAFAQGGVTVHGQSVGKGDRAEVGMELQVAQLFECCDTRAQPVPGRLDLVYEDEELLAVNKPGNMDCHPVEPGESGTVANALLARFPQVAEVGGDPMMPGLLHRIDAGTSGLVLVARTEAAFVHVRQQFAQHTVEKTYRAVVEGRVDRPGGVEGYLAHTPGDRGRMRIVTPHGAPRGERPLRAATFFRPLRTFREHTLLHVTIHTGVTHQIRCQLASLGHPVFGDTTYGAPRRFETGVRRHFLHAASVALQHPRTGRSLVLEAPVADDMRAWIDGGST